MASPKKPVMDVSKPGKTAADATARPIITGHAMMKDPMVTEDTTPTEGVTEEVATTETEEVKSVTPSTTHKVIQPLESAAVEEVSESPVEAEKPSEQTDPVPEETKEEPKKEETTVSDDAVVDAVLDQVSDKKEETKESEEEHKRQELVDKLVEEKKYFLPINQVHSRRNNRLALLVLGALLPVIVGLGLAADAGAINLGFKVPFDFIKDKTPAQQTTTQTVPTTQQSQQSVLPAMKGIEDTDSAKWTSVKSGLGGFTVKIPDGWQVTSFKPANLLISDVLTSTPGTAAKVSVETQNPGFDGQPRFEVTQYKNTDKFSFLDGDEQKQDFISGTLKGTRYYKKYPLQAIDGLGPYPGSEVYKYEFKTKDTTTYLIYSIVNYNQYTKTSGITKSDVNQLTLVEKLVKTLQITQ